MDSTSRVQQAHKFWLHHKIPSSNQTKLRWPPFWSLMVITAGQTTRQDKSNKYHKISNLNTLKLSYCCTTNVENIIKQDNSKVLSRTNDHNIPKCNCRSKPSSPLNVEYLTQCLVFKPSSTASSNSFVCYGNSEDEFETWYNNHIESLRHREYNEWDWVIIMVLLPTFHEKSTKRPHNTNVVQNVATPIFWKKFPSFVLIQTLY